MKDLWEHKEIGDNTIFHFNSIIYTDGLPNILNRNLPESKTNLTLLDILTNIYLKKQFRDEDRYNHNLCYLLKPFQKTFYSHHSITHAFDKTNLKYYDGPCANTTEVVHIPRVGDLHIQSSHAFILKKRLNHYHRDLFLRESNNQLAYLLELELRQKSAFQIEELVRAAHEYILNRSARLKHGNITSYPGFSLNCHPDFFNTNLNVSSSFLDLYHSLPFERSLFAFNNTLSFQKDKTTIIGGYMRVYLKKVIAKYEEASPKDESNPSFIPCLNDPNHPERNPLPLAVFAALALKRNKINLQWDPTPKYSSIKQYFENFGEVSQRMLSLFTFDLNSTLGFKPRDKFMRKLYVAQKHDRQMRRLFLESIPNHSVFPYPKSVTTNQLNSWFHFVALSLVNTTHCLHIIQPYNFDEFAPVHVRSLQRNNQNDCCMPLLDIETIPDSELSTQSDDLYESSDNDGWDD